MAEANGGKKLYVPGSDARPEEIFSFPFLIEDESVKFIADHGRVMFITRGPPGSGKNTLSQMICDKYPTSVVCSADSYFSQAFVSKERNRESLKASHDFCAKRVEEECENGSHPIIVRNTHIKIWELAVYINFAAKYGYTVIMAITVRKFVTDPKVLERTNKKGLSEKYLRGRMNGWKECIPSFLGWFLCPEDESFVFLQAKQTLESLLGDGMFCRVLGVYCKDEVMKYFKRENQLFCIATFCNCGKSKETFKFYLSQKVQDVYGKCFSLNICAFVISKDYILAVTEATLEMQSLMLSKNRTPKEPTLESMMGNLTIQESSLPEMGKSTFENDFSAAGKTAELKDCLSGELNTSSMSFIVLSRSSTKAKINSNMWDLAQTMFGSIVNSEGIIEEHVFSELDDGTKYCRLPNDLWLVPLAKKITLSTIFTGLYSMTNFRQTSK